MCSSWARTCSLVAWFVRSARCTATGHRTIAAASVGAAGSRSMHGVEHGVDGLVERGRPGRARRGRVAGWRGRRWCAARRGGSTSTRVRRAARARRRPRSAMPRADVAGGLGDHESTSEIGVDAEAWRPRRVHRARSSVTPSAGLAGSGVAGRFAFHRGVLAVARVTAVAVDELGDAVVHLDGDLVGALRELVQQLGRDTGDLGLAVDDLDRTRRRSGRSARRAAPTGRGSRTPADAASTLGASSAYQRPSAVWTLEEMTTWVWSCGSSARLVDWRNTADRQAVGLGMEPCPVRADAGGRAVLLDHLDRGVDGAVVALGEAVVAGESPQHRHRLRCRERRVVAGDRLDHVAVLVDAVEQFTTERLAGDG